MSEKKKADPKPERVPGPLVIQVYDDLGLPTEYAFRQMVTGLVDRALAEMLSRKITSLEIMVQELE